MTDFIIKPATGSGNKVILQDQGGAAFLTSANSGATIGSNVTFPAGHVIRNFYKEDDGGEHTVSDPSAADERYSELEIEITSPSTSNSLIVTLYLASVSNLGYNGNSLFAGLVYSTDNFTNATNLKEHGQTGSFPWALSRTCYNEAHDQLINNMSMTFRFNHPVSSTYKIRPRLRNNGSQCRINTGVGRSTITAFEIKGTV